MGALLASSTASNLFAGLGVLLTLVLVLVLAYYLTRLYARKMGASLVGGKYIAIHDRVVTGQGSALMIVEVEGQFLLVGMSDKGINLISELQGFEPRDNLGPKDGAGFAVLLTGLMQKMRKTGQGGDEKADG